MAKKVAYAGMLVALAMIFSYVEALIPINFGIPGIKLGLANLVVLSGLYRMKPGEIFLVSIARILLVGFLFGNGMSIIYSLAGGTLSFLIMFILIRTEGFSPAGVSVAGSVSHNIGQLAAASCILRSTSVFWYLPVLLPAGLAAGILTGMLSKRLLPVLRDHAGTV